MTELYNTEIFCNAVFLKVPLTFNGRRKPVKIIFLDIAFQYVLPFRNAKACGTFELYLESRIIAYIFTKVNEDRIKMTEIN